VHEQKGFVIAVAIATLGFADGAMAREEAAEKAQEGGIDHPLTPTLSPRNRVEREN
jgi:hypothetical protein